MRQNSRSLKILALLLALTIFLAPAASTAYAVAEGSGPDWVDTIHIGNKEITQYNGRDRYHTAALVATAGNNKSDVVILASGEVEPDALAASMLVYKYKAPILLTRARSMPAITRATLEKLAPSKVIVVGGEVTIGSSQLTGYNVTRLAGVNRYETAIKVMEHVHGPGYDWVMFVSGEKFPDAISAAGVAANLPIAILFVGKDQVPAVVTEAAKNADTDVSWIVGGPSTISERVAGQLGLANRRISGENRYSTSNQLLREYFGVPVTVVMASGENYPDALVASYLANQFKTGIRLQPNLSGILEMPHTIFKIAGGLIGDINSLEETPPTTEPPVTEPPVTEPPVTEPSNPYPGVDPAVVNLLPRIKALADKVNKIANPELYPENMTQRIKRSRLVMNDYPERLKGEHKNYYSSLVTARHEIWLAEYVLDLVRRYEVEDGALRTELNDFYVVFNQAKDLVYNHKADYMPDSFKPLEDLFYNEANPAAEDIGDSYIGRYLSSMPPEQSEFNLYSQAEIDSLTARLLGAIDNLQLTEGGPDPPETEPPVTEPENPYQGIQPEVIALLPTMKNLAEGFDRLEPEILSATLRNDFANIKSTLESYPELLKDEDLAIVAEYNKLETAEALIEKAHYMRKLYTRYFDGNGVMEAQLESFYRAIDGAITIMISGKDYTEESTKPFTAAYEAAMKANYEIATTIEYAISKGIEVKDYPIYSSEQTYNLMIALEEATEGLVPISAP